MTSVTNISEMDKSMKVWIIVRCRIAIMFGALLAACQVADAQRDFVSFERIILDEQMLGGYGVEVADVDSDGLTDIIALATNPAQLIWYKNPGWGKHPITVATQANVDVASNDIDNDGDVDLALASSFNLGVSTEGGLIHWLENPGDPVMNQEWQMHYIDEIPTSHRIKWGDVNGDKKRELINLPIIGIGASGPEYNVDLQLKAYSIPNDLSVDRWEGIVLDQSLQLSHGISVSDWDKDGRQDILTASFYGVHLFQLATRGQSVARTWIGAGKQDAERPAIGSSEVGEGVIDKGIRYVAAIEPWHGNEVVVYTEGENTLWDRTVIDDQIANGHGLLVADLNNDGIDEIIAGGRSEPYQLAIYHWLQESSRWQRIALDEGSVAVSGLATDDLNGDGYLDIVAIGSGTGNVIYYENNGR